MRDNKQQFYKAFLYLIIHIYNGVVKLYRYFMIDFVHNILYYYILLYFKIQLILTSA